MTLHSTQLLMCHMEDTYHAYGALRTQHGTIQHEVHLTNPEADEQTGLSLQMMGGEFLLPANSYELEFLDAVYLVILGDDA